MKKILLIIGGGVFLVMLLGSIGKNSSSQQAGNPTETKKVAVVEATPTPKLQYEILSKIDNKAVENISVLIKSGEADPKGITVEVQKSCKKKCNISVYDDKKAYELDTEYTNKMLSYDVTVAEREAWKKKNTVFLADHLIATVGDSFGPYSEYPLKDSYYKELKGEK